MGRGLLLRDLEGPCTDRLTPEASQTVAGGGRRAATSGSAGQVEGTPEEVPEVRGHGVWHPSGMRPTQHDLLRGSRSRTRSTPGYHLARRGRGLAFHTPVHGEAAGCLRTRSGAMDPRGCRRDARTTGSGSACLSPIPDVRNRRSIQDEESLHRVRISGMGEATWFSWTCSGAMNPPRRVGGPGLQVVGPVPPPGGSWAGKAGQEDGEWGLAK